MSLIKHDIYRFEDFELDPTSRTFSRLGVQVPLFPKAFEVLIYLVSNPGRVITKEEIFKAVWQDSFVEEGNLARQISSLRRALADRADCIVTVPGRGYQFAARVEGLPSAAVSPEVRTEEVLVQRTRERILIDIDESFPAADGSAQATVHPAQLSRRSKWKWAALGAVTVVVLGACAWYGWRRFHPRTGRSCAPGHRRS